MSEKPE